MTPLLAITIDEQTKPADLERIRRNIFDALRELQQQGVPRIIKEGLVLDDGVVTPIAHGLGRRPRIWTSPPQGASTSGRIEEIRDGDHDQARFTVLKATGWGASITIDVYAI